MAHILVPSLPPGAQKSDYAPVKQWPRRRDRRSSGKGKAGAGDNSGSNELMHVLQNAFESNWYGPGSTNTSPKERRTKKSAKEVVVVDDDEDEEGEQEKEKQRVNLPLTLDQALATYSRSTRRVLTWLQRRRPRRRLKDRLWQVAARDNWRNTRAESLSDSCSMEVVVTSPTKRPRKHARAQADSNKHIL